MNLVSFNESIASNYWKTVKSKNIKRGEQRRKINSSDFKLF